jgi:hypothetical protein
MANEGVRYSENIGDKSGVQETDILILRLTTVSALFMINASNQDRLEASACQNRPLPSTYPFAWAGRMIGDELPGGCLVQFSDAHVDGWSQGDFDSIWPSLRKCFEGSGSGSPALRLTVMSHC